MVGSLVLGLSSVVFARSHVSSPGGVTLLDPDLFWDPELDIGPHRLMALGAFLSLQNR